ncbi:MAG: 2-oxoacid:ferredoxin oxidoreductase subunit gamma [Clostridiales bacterium]|nr:2-oxoacid:ferredoxin oxidoreductase subunit gamma [Clostridiales bacterium]
MDAQLIIAGFGGQGVLLMGQLLAYAGMIEGRQVSWMPAYGPEMRGGSANCSVVISGAPVGSPKVEDADVVIAMNRPSMELFKKNVVPGGLLLVNSSLISVPPRRADVRVLDVPCSELADRLGNGRVANMVMLGALIGATGLFSADALVEALRHKLGPAKERLIPINRAAIEAGMARAAALPS